MYVKERMTEICKQDFAYKWAVCYINFVIHDGIFVKKKVYHTLKHKVLNKLSRPTVWWVTNFENVAVP